MDGSNEAMLIIAPQFDEATQYSRAWAEWLSQMLLNIKYSHILVPAYQTPIARKEVENLLMLNYKPIVFLDHGSEDALWCNPDEPCIDLNNIDMIKNNIIYTMACQSARKLGAKAYELGNIYVGYIDNFIFSLSYHTLFRDASLSGVILYANGERDWVKIKQAMVSAFNNAVNQTPDPFTKSLLIYDRNILRVYAPNADDPKKDRGGGVLQRICSIFRRR